MDYALIDEAEAPPRPPFRRGGRRQQEMDAVIAALTERVAARIALPDPAKAASVRRQLFEAAARAARPIEVWEGDGAVYAALEGAGLGAEIR